MEKRFVLRRLGKLTMTLAEKSAAGGSYLKIVLREVPRRLLLQEKRCWLNGRGHKRAALYIC